MLPSTAPVLTATIVEWDRQKGYGFLQLGKQRVFLHRGDFAGRHRTPAVGDKIRFTFGQDAKGRTCAQNAVPANAGVGILAVSLSVLIGLLLLPVFAVWQRGLDFRWVGGCSLILSALTYWEYARDKRRAQEGEWRLSEARLHLLELLGGWPGAWLAQRRLRHKCSKGSYQIVFWLIVLAWQFAAFDSLRNWQYSRSALHWFERTSKYRK